MSAKDGGPAFPSNDEGNWIRGISLRDYFANTAKDSLIISWPTEARVNGGWVSEDDYYQLAKEAYKIADAMLAEREKERG